MHHDQIMKSYIQLTPLNNYLSNCVIKLHIKLHTHVNEKNKIPCKLNQNKSLFLNVLYMRPTYATEKNKTFFEPLQLSYKLNQNKNKSLPLVFLSMSLRHVSEK